MRDLMTYEEAIATIPPGKYRHFKGKPYEVISIARHSETEEPMVVYRALYGEHGLWTRPAAMWNEQIIRDGQTYTRFAPMNGSAQKPDDDGMSGKTTHMDGAGNETDGTE